MENNENEALAKEIEGLKEDIKNKERVLNRDKQSFADFIRNNPPVFENGCDITKMQPVKPNKESVWTRFLKVLGIRK
jgi:tRNA1(Val) A37 N6-methylase TrmN6